MKMDTEAKGGQIGYKKFILISILIRDVFGYFLGGVFLIVLVSVRFNFSSRLSGSYGESLLVLLVLSLSYILGRIAFLLGSGLLNFVSLTSWARAEMLALRAMHPSGGTKKPKKSLRQRLVGLWHRPSVETITGIVRDMKLPLIGELKRSSGKSVPEDEILYSLVPDLALTRYPDIYFVRIARPNNLRMLGETTLGLVVLSTLLLIEAYISGVELPVTWVIVFPAVFLLILFCWYQAYKLRQTYIKDLIRAAWTLSALMSADDHKPAHEGSQG